MDVPGRQMSSGAPQFARRLAAWPSTSVSSWLCEQTQILCLLYPASWLSNETINEPHSRAIRLARACHFVLLPYGAIYSFGDESLNVLVTLVSKRVAKMLLASRPGVRAFTSSHASSRTMVAPRAALSTAKLVEDISKTMLKTNPPECRVGDTVRVGLAVQEAKGKTRTQKLEGTIIAEAGVGANKTVTLRRIFQGVGIEIKLPLHAPAVQGIEVIRRGRVRRAKLYYLRDRQGRSARLKELKGAKGKLPSQTAAAKK